MAAIREYTAPATGLAPSDLGETSLVRAATRVNALSDETGRIIKQSFDSIGEGFKNLGHQVELYQTRQELQSAAVSGQQMLNAKSQANDALFNAPDAYKDPAIVSKAITAAGEGWADWQSTFVTKGGKDYAQQFVNHAIDHLSHRAAADGSTLSRLGLEQNLNDFLNHSSQIIANDPSALENQKALAKMTFQSLVESYPNLQAADRMKALNEHLGQVYKKQEETALQHLAMTNPAAAREQWAAGRFGNILGDHADAVLKMGDTMARQRASEAHTEQMWQDHENDKQLWGNAFREGGKLDPTTGRFIMDAGYLDKIIRSVGTPGGASPTAAREMMQYALKPETQSAPGAFHDTLQGLLDGKYTEREVFDRVGAMGPNSLSKTDAQFILSTTDKMDSPARKMLSATLEEAKHNLLTKDPILGQTDPIGYHNLTQFTAWFMPKFQSEMRAGKAASTLLNPNSPDYIMKDVPWEQFKNTNTSVGGALGGIQGLAGAAGASFSANLPFWQRIRDFGERSQASDVSPKGAQGEMQVMPGTAMAPGLGVRPENPNLPGDKERVGRDYADALVDRYDQGRTAVGATLQERVYPETLAAAAYNAGMGRVDDWIRQFGDPRTGAITLTDFVNKIPIKETRDYVRRVMGEGSQLPEGSARAAAAKAAWDAGR